MFVLYEFFSIILFFFYNLYIQYTLDVEGVRKLLYKIMIKLNFLISLYMYIYCAHQLPLVHSYRSVADTNYNLQTQI